MTTSIGVVIGIALLVTFAFATVGWRRRRPRTGGRKGSGPSARTAAGERKREALASEAFRRQGYEPIESPRSAGLGGGELLMRRDRQTFLVGCAHWHRDKVGVEILEALQRSMLAKGAAGGFMLTEGRFSRAAIAFAAPSNIRLIAGDALRDLLAGRKPR